MKLICTCNNCKATIIYKESDIESTIKCFQADPVCQGKLIVWEQNVFKKLILYYINCPQCKKDIICGRETLEDRIYIK